MFRPSLPPRSRRSALVASLATLAVTAALTSTPGGSASSAPLDGCPDVFPQADLVRGQDVQGLTVSEGTTPGEFGGKVIGVLEDGIAPDVDMIMMRLTSDEITRVGGIWAGMSGSPVYAEDGTLIGAVAYGLSWGPSPVAGITPAADMKKLLDLDALGGRAPVKVAIPRGTADRLVARGDLTRAQADEGMKQLATPLGISGMGTTKRLTKATKRLGLTNVKVFRSAGAPAQRVPAAGGLVPGGNLAASLSYGDFSAVGTGTVTMVCGDQVVGFGHPFDWTGKTSLTLHDADALYIQEDSLGAPFKVSNPSAPVGTIDQDRQVGIAGFGGDTPPTTEVTSDIDSTEGGSRVGHTYVSMQDYLPDLAALGVVANAGKVLDAVTDGNATYDFTISGTTKPRNGTPEAFTVQRDNVMASSWDIAYMAPEELYEVLWRLRNNKFTALDIDSIDFTGTLSPDFEKYKISYVEVKQDGAWSKVTRRTKVVAHPGQVLKLRATLGSFRDELPARQVALNVPVTWSQGESGIVLIGGGGSSDFFFKSAARSSARVQARAGSFDALVDSIESAPRNDEVSATLYSFETDNVSDPVVSPPQEVPVGGSKSFRLVVRK